MSRVPGSYPGPIRSHDSTPSSPGFGAPARCELSVNHHEIPELSGFLHGEVVPEQGVGGVEGDSVLFHERKGLACRTKGIRCPRIPPCGKTSFRVHTAGNTSIGIPFRWMASIGIHPPIPNFRLPPLRAKGPRHERMIVLGKLAEGDQDLAQVHHPGDLILHLLGPGAGVQTDGAAAPEGDDGSFDGVAGGDGSGLPGTFDLDLGSDGQEPPGDRQRRGMNGQGCGPGGACATVPEPEPPFTGRVGEHRPPGDDVLHVLEVGFHPLLPLPLSLDKISEEVPTADPEPFHMLKHLGGLQADPLGDDQTRTPPDPVGVEGIQIAVPGYLLVLGGLPVDGDGAVPHDHLDLCGFGGVLEMLEATVQGDLLLEPLHLPVCGLIVSDTELLPGHVRDEHAHGLARTPGGTDGAREVDGRVPGPVGVLFQLHLGYPLQGCHQYPLGEDGQTGPDSLIDGFLGGAPVLPRQFTRQDDGDLFPVPDLCKELADPHGDTGGAHQVLHPGGEVLGKGDLHLLPGIDPQSAGGIGDPVRMADLPLQFLEVPEHLLPHAGVFGARIRDRPSPACPDARTPAGNPVPRLGFLRMHRVPTRSVPPLRDRLRWYKGRESCIREKHPVPHRVKGVKNLSVARHARHLR